MLREPVGAARRAPVAVADWPAVSVIVPVYNCDRFLAEALESIVAQTAPLVEVIVVDDGSTDDSAAVAERFAADHPVVQVLRRENGGPGVARNDAIAIARGEFLVFHDADDVMVEDRVVTQVSYLIDRPEVSVVIGSVEVQFEPNVDRNAAWVRKEMANLAYNGGFNLMAMTARASAFAELGGFDPSYRLAEDYNWIVRALAHDYSVAVVPALVTKRRLHGRNVSSDIEESQHEMFRSFLEHIRAKRTG